MDVKHGCKHDDIRPHDKNHECIGVMPIAKLVHKYDCMKRGVQRECTGYPMPI